MNPVIFIAGVCLMANPGSIDFAPKAIRRVPEVRSRFDLHHRPAACLWVEGSGRSVRMRC